MHQNALENIFLSRVRSPKSVIGNAQELFEETVELILLQIKNMKEM